MQTKWKPSSPARTKPLKGCGLGRVSKMEVDMGSESDVSMTVDRRRGVSVGLV